MNVVLRPAHAGDLEHVKRALFDAVAWDPERKLPPFEVAVEHPQLARYHRGWVRDGDFGLVAELDGEVVGVITARLFIEDDHGHGFVDEQTPEIAIAVSERVRGMGIGTQLLEALADSARARGLTRLSLSVENTNPARRLYERAGYRELSTDEDGVRMLLEL